MSINTKKQYSVVGSQGSVKKKRLRSGYTTGACAAAAAKAATLLLLSADVRKYGSVKVKEKENKSQQNLRSYDLSSLRAKDVDIPFPDGSRVKFRVHGSGIRGQENTAWASVIKDAGDDPDVTHGAEIVAEATIVRKSESVKERKGERRPTLCALTRSRTYELVIKGGKGVGTVTKPGLAIPVGESAINPVPRKMIEEAVHEALSVKERKRESVKGKKDINAVRNNLRAYALTNLRAIEITISVPDGEELAKKTLNHRLGIVGGISILGTTGIVTPVSTEAWTATITSSMDVAKATGHKEIVLSAGRSSEKAHMKTFNFPEEAYVLMGDYLEYSLREAEKHGFKKIHLCAQWAKMLKIAMATPQTHVRFGAINTGKAVEFLHSLGIGVPQDHAFNTAREIFEFINSSQNAGGYCIAPLQLICNSAKKYAGDIVKGIPVIAYLVSYEREIIARCE